MSKQDMQDILRIEPIYTKYPALDDAVTRKQVEGRIDYFLHAMDAFIRVMGYEGKISVNQGILACAVFDYFTDIMRLKKETGIKSANEFKIAAYEAQWLLSRRALQSSDLGVCFANEEFVLSHLLKFLYREKSPEEQKVASRTMELRRLHESLFFHLKFRNCDARTLELMLLAFRAGEVLARDIDVRPQVEAIVAPA